jgi:hypothetical protein
MAWRERQPRVPKVKSPYWNKDTPKQRIPEVDADYLIIHPSPQNKVVLCEGRLRKIYDAVGAKSGKKCGVSAVVQFSAGAGYGILMEDHAAIWKETDALDWFKSDVKKAAGEDAAIRAFVASHPEMRLTI